MLIKAALGDWVYLVIGLIWVGYSFYKKMKLNTSSDDKATAKKDISPSFLDSFKNQWEVVQTGEEPDEDQWIDDKDSGFVPLRSGKTENQPAESFFSYDDLIIDEEKNHPEQATKSVFEASSVENNKKASTCRNVTKRRRKKINLKKAVVYSAILHRPSF